MFDGVARRERGELTLRQAMGIHELDVQLECLGIRCLHRRCPSPATCHNPARAGLRVYRASSPARLTAACKALRLLQ